MFDIGFSELIVIAVIALVVLGPERLPRAARFAGLWVRRARAQWYSVRSEFERELAAEELKRSMNDARSSLREVETQLHTAGHEAQQQVDDVRKQARSGLTQPEFASVHEPPQAPTAPVASTDHHEPRP